MHHRCPTCKSIARLEVVIETWAKLIQPEEEPSCFETDMDAASEHDHEWSENSAMRCTNRECEDEGTIRSAQEFEVPTCDECDVEIGQAGDGYDNLCGACADRKEAKPRLLDRTPEGRIICPGCKKANGSLYCGRCEHCQPCGEGT